MSPLFQPALAAALVAATAGAIAQPAGAVPAAAVSAAAAPASAPVGAYRSAFAGYRPFTDQPVGSWRGANDVVGRIGGWQAYAREGAGEPNPPKAASAPMSGHKMP